ATDDRDGPASARAMLLLVIDQASIPLGAVITGKFHDGTTAQYVKQSDFATYQWIWNGVANDKNGHRIYRNGTLVGNSNTSGTGEGHVNVPGFGSGSSWGFGLGAVPTCTFIPTITVSGERTDD